MGFRSWFVNWLLSPELEREVQRKLEGMDVVALRKEVNRLRNEKHALINKLRKMGGKVPKKWDR